MKIRSLFAIYCCCLVICSCARENNSRKTPHYVNPYVNNKNCSFSKVTIESVLDNGFYDYTSSIKREHVLLEVVVQEDYFGKQSSSERVLLPVLTEYLLQDGAIINIKEELLSIITASESPYIYYSCPPVVVNRTNFKDGDNNFFVTDLFIAENALNFQMNYVYFLNIQNNYLNENCFYEMLFAKGLIESRTDLINITGIFENGMSRSDIERNIISLKNN